MPVLLPEDINIKLPAMSMVKQRFDKEYIKDIEAAIENELVREEITNMIKPGQKIAIAVGSRGIDRIDQIVKKTVECLKNKGAFPFIVSAMGSHGGGTVEGQRAMLDGYGITEEKIGAPVVVSLDVVEIGTTTDGYKIYTDKTACEADMTVLINRVKPHTDFEGDIESGLCKMSVIGLGNHVGCATIHKAGFSNFSKIIKEASEVVCRKSSVGFGIAIVENSVDKTFKIEAVLKDNMYEKDKELLQLAKAKMASIKIPEIDVLIVEEIGKDISGNGVDSNIVGRHGPKAFDPAIPKIHRMVVLGLTHGTHGNAIGIGTADVTTRKVFREIDFEATYANGIASGDSESVKIPIVVEDEKEAIAVAVKLWGGTDIQSCRIVRIKNSLELEYIWVSEALMPYIKEKREDFEIVNS